MVLFLVFDMKSCLNSGATLRAACITCGDNAPNTEVFPVSSPNTDLRATGNKAIKK